MQINRVLTDIAVSNMDASVRWYQAFLGTPASARPMPILADWEFDGGTLQLVLDAERAGRSLVSLDVSDLKTIVGDLARQGLASQPAEIAAGDTVSFAQVTDPDGNAITLVESPSS